MYILGIFASRIQNFQQIKNHLPTNPPQKLIAYHLMRFCLYVKLRQLLSLPANYAFTLPHVIDTIRTTHRLYHQQRVYALSCPCFKLSTSTQHRHAATCVRSQQKTFNPSRRTLSPVRTRTNTATLRRLHRQYTKFYTSLGAFRCH